MECGGSPSEITFVLRAQEDSGSEFKSKSSVSAVDESATSDYDGLATLEITTEDEETSVTFWHELHYFNAVTFPEGSNDF